MPKRSLADVENRLDHLEQAVGDIRDNHLEHIKGCIGNLSERISRLDERAKLLFWLVTATFGAVVIGTIAALFSRIIGL